MKKLRLKSNLAASEVAQNALPSKNPLFPFPCGANGLLCLGLSLCMASCPGAAFYAAWPASAAGPSVAEGAADQKSAKAPRSTGGKRPAQDYWLTVTVRNPNCPACLKTIKVYLLALNGVREVFINNLRAPEKNIDIKVRLAGAAQAARVIERVKAHDLEILGIKPASFN
jgi:hypothetical protein